MWIWNGKICPEPGEQIEHACVEAILIARQWGGGRKAEYDGKSYGPYFEFEFNGVLLRIWRDSSVEELVVEYHETLKKRKHAAVAQPD